MPRVTLSKGGFVPSGSKGKLPSFFEKLPRFGDQLREYRTLRGISVEQIAAEVGVTASAIRDMESGTRSAPSQELVGALSIALRLNGDERDSLLQAAALDSPVLNAIFGREPKSTARPPLTAAILVFLIADIRGYTAFTREFGDEAAAQLTTRFAELAQAAVERWDGQLVETRGDEVLAVFASARQAVRAAHDIQQQYTALRETDLDLPLGIGIGLDLGEAVPVDGGYRGAALNRAARLCGLAAPGEILVSTGVVYVAPQIDGITFVHRGQEQVKGFEAPIPILLAAPAELSE